MTLIVEGAESLSYIELSKSASNYYPERIILDAQECRDLFNQLSNETGMHYDEPAMIQEILGLIIDQHEAAGRVSDKCDDYSHDCVAMNVVYYELKVFNHYYQKIGEALKTLLEANGLYENQGRHVYVYDHYHVVTGTLLLKRIDLVYREILTEWRDNGAELS